MKKFNLKNNLPIVTFLSIQTNFFQGFHFPLAVVICHLLVKFLFSAIIRCIRACWKKQQQLKLPLKSIIWMVMPIGIASGLDVGLSNWAISLITMSLYVIYVGNSSNIFNIATLISFPLYFYSGIL